MPEHTPLPVHGYTTQSADKVELVNTNKELEEAVLQIFDVLYNRQDVDKRWLAVARTHIEQGFMAANRAVFQPKRITE